MKINAAIIKNVNDIEWDMWEPERDTGNVYFVFSDKEHEYFISFENISIGPHDDVWQYTGDKNLGFTEEVFKDGKSIEDEEEIKRIFNVLINEYGAEFENKEAIVEKR